MQIKKITDPSHPAYTQYGLFAKKKLEGNTLIIPYLGIIHASLTPSDGSTIIDDHEESDYDLSLVRISADHRSNPFSGSHISIGVDAARAGNAGRFVNDYRGICGAPNAEFRVGHGEGGEMRMEIWSLKAGVRRGDEIVVSYGKGWWNSRKG